MTQPIRTWQEDAECKGHYDPDFWWYDYPNPDNKEARSETILRLSVALEYCAECPVRKQCLTEGLLVKNLHPGSVWGGLLYSQRRRLAKKHVSVRYYNEDWILKGLERLAKRRTKGD